MTESLRDTIENAVESVENAAIPGEGLQADAPAEILAEPAAAPAGDDKAASDRARDEKGRFVEQKGDAPAKPVAAKAAPAAAPVTTPQAPAEPAKPAIPRPSTWKKEHWEAFDKLAAENPALAAYLNEREQQFTRGVSTYKQEWERAKPLLDSMEQFMPDLQKHGIEPHQWISNLGNAHKTLALGSPEQKLSMFSQLARDYGVPLEQLFVRGQDGNIYRNSQYDRPMQQAPAQPQVRQQDVQKMVQEAMATQAANAEAEKFLHELDKYPHFESVRDDMIRLLESGFADSYASAYETALRLPQHEQLYAQAQEQRRQAEEARNAEERRKQAEAARRKAVSPRSSTPTGAVTKGEGKGLRSAIESAFDQHAEGRV